MNASGTCEAIERARPDMDELNTSEYIAPFFLAIYLLVGNVMLLNLLIAIFTSVFEEVHENSNEGVVHQILLPISNSESTKFVNKYISRSAHRTTNFMNPEFQFPQFKVLQSIFIFLYDQ